jgi:signal transduction histidine kinase
LDNAIKYSAPTPRITVRGREENGEFVLSVADNGMGFDMQYKEKIFELFQRLHRSDEIEGTGIGLSIVKRAVEKHGGRAWAESELGKGATFHIALPTEWHGRPAREPSGQTTTGETPVPLKKERRTL